MKAIDLFSGAGGFSYGFSSSGWSILSANDSDRQAADTYKLNHPETKFFACSVIDLTATMMLRATDSKRGEIDCLIGGPPCQAFSFNNHARSVSDSRALLYKEYLRLVHGIYPKTLVMENVPGILSIDGGKVISHITDFLTLLGYSVFHDVVRAEQYGVPQTRKRVLFVASRIGDPLDMIPIPTHQKRESKGKTLRSVQPERGSELSDCITIKDAIGDLPPLENGGNKNGCRYTSRAVTAFQKEARKGVQLLTAHQCSRLGQINLQRMSYIPSGGNWRDIPRHLLPSGMKRANLSDHTTRYGRLVWNNLATTLLTKCDPHWGAYIHPAQDRVLSVREAARLQGFPDRFTFADVGITQQYRQIGNAVPVQLGMAIARAVEQHLQANTKARYSKCS